MASLTTIIFANIRKGHKNMSLKDSQKDLFFLGSQPKQFLNPLLCYMYDSQKY